jgi:hypothetical protein
MVSHRLNGCCFALLTLVAACSSPTAQAPAAIAAPVAATVVSTGDTSDAPAKTCSWAGMRWRYYDVSINPTMTVSNDGYCEVHAHLSANTAVLMQVQKPPQHGQLAISAAYTSRASVRYSPNKGYVGTDSFVIETGSARHAVIANFTVTVTG